MRTTVQPVPPIARGYPYRVRLQCPAENGVAPFPLGCALAADVALYTDEPSRVLGLGTADGSIVRVDDLTIELHMTAAHTATLTNRTAVLDLVRTDGAVDDWLGIRIQLPVIDPVTTARPR